VGKPLFLVLAKDWVDPLPADERSIMFIYECLSALTSKVGKQALLMPDEQKC
jgi:hypothetical protein